MDHHSLLHAWNIVLRKGCYLLKKKLVRELEEGHGNMMGDNEKYLFLSFTCSVISYFGLYLLRNVNRFCIHGYLRVLILHYVILVYHVFDVAAYSPIISNLWKSIDGILEWCYEGSIGNKWYCLFLWLTFTVDYSCGPGHLLLLLFLTTSAEHWILRNIWFFLAIWTYVVVL